MALLRKNSKIYLLVDSLADAKKRKVRLKPGIEMIGLFPKRPGKPSLNLLKRRLKTVSKAIYSKSTMVVIVENPVVYNLLIKKNSNRPVTKDDMLFRPNRKFMAAITSNNEGSIHEALNSVNFLVDVSN